MSPDFKLMTATSNGATGFGQVARAVHVRGPQVFLINGAMREQRGAVHHSGNLVVTKSRGKQCLVPQVALNADEVRVVVGVRHQIEIDAGKSFVEKAALEDSAEESRPASNEDVGHVALRLMNWRGTRKRRAPPRLCRSDKEHAEDYDEWFERMALAGFNDNEVKGKR